jgi:hypothetical protein
VEVKQIFGLIRKCCRQKAKKTSEKLEKQGLKKDRGNSNSTVYYSDSSLRLKWSYTLQHVKQRR